VPSSNAPRNEADLDIAVADGAVYLDSLRLNLTTRWRNYIDWNRLDMGSAKRDILGQLGTTDTRLGLTETDAIDYGLLPNIDDRDHANALTAAWQRWHANQQAPQAAGNGAADTERKAVA
jgi:hypothetical protein